MQWVLWQSRGCNSGLKVQSYPPAVSSCIWLDFPWDFLLPPAAAQHYWSLSPQPSTVSPGLLKHVMCSRNVRLVPSPEISHSPPKGLQLHCRAHELQTPSVHLIKDSLSLKSTFKWRMLNQLLLAVSGDSFVQKGREILAHSREKAHQTFNTSSGF